MAHALQWVVPSFRKALSDLLYLDRGQQARLRDVVRGDGELVAILGEDEEANEAIRSGANALNTLWHISQTEGLPSLMADVEQLLEGDLAERAEEIRKLLAVSKEESQRALIARTQASLLPILTALSVEVDFRTVPERLSGDSAVLVPVFVARARFDEPIASGNEAIVFQIPDEQVDAITESLANAARLRDAILGSLPDGLVPEVLSKGAAVKDDDG